MKADKYNKLKKCRYRKQQNETNDCSVIAIAIACRYTYKKSHQIMSEVGRQKRKGASNMEILLAANRDFELTPIKNLKQKSGSRFTPKTIGNKLKAGYYIAFVNGHVFSIVNGTVHDWTQGRQHHITEVWKVTRKRA